LAVGSKSEGRGHHRGGQLRRSGCSSSAATRAATPGATRRACSQSRWSQGAPSRIWHTRTT